MSTPTDVTHYESKLRDLLDNRIASGSDLAEAAAHVTTVRAQLEQAERAYTAAFTAALGSGWT